MATPSGGPRLGLVVNPVAGLGGAVGLHGSDGAATVVRALALGAVPHAEERTAAALRALVTRWPARLTLPRVLTGAGMMGEACARAAGLEPEVVDRAADPAATSAEDTRRLVGRLVEAGVELLLVAGGDGTARDVAAVAPPELPVLGVPAGVKIQSAVYAVSPRAAGELAAVFLAAEPGRRRTDRRELLDLDEDAYRTGAVSPRLHGELTVPAADRRLQARKEPTPRSEAAAAAGIAEELGRGLVPGERIVLGPGSTLATVKTRLGIAPTLVGVDLVEATGPGAARPLVTDASERDLLAAVGDGDATLVVTPIGGQGFILGRGNQQLGPALVRAVLERRGRDGLVVIAVPTKLAALGGRPLLVESGDPALDGILAGYVRVVTGPGERTIYPVAAA